MYKKVTHRVGWIKTQQAHRPSETLGLTTQPTRYSA